MIGYGVPFTEGVATNFRAAVNLHPALFEINRDLRSKGVFIDIYSEGRNILIQTGKLPQIIDLNTHLPRVVEL